MDKYEIIRRIEQFAPPETAEAWDCVGFEVETPRVNISKIMLCLTVTQNIVNRAREQNCDMIISHHPLFYVPLAWCDIDIYSAHTNLDKAEGGTTDTIISTLGLDGYRIRLEHEFLRMVDFGADVTVDDFVQKLKTISPNMRHVNNKKVSNLRRVAFCAGSGSEFINESKSFGADALVTGDLKFHPALDSEIIVFDIGHYESEIIVLPVFQKIIGDGVEVVFAQEECPFIYI